MCAFVAGAAAESQVAKEPKEPRKAPFRLGDLGEAHANMRELLLNALLVIANRTSVGSLDKWADDVRLERGAALELKEQWKPLESWGKYNGVSKLYKPMLDTVNRSWETGVLARRRRHGDARVDLARRPVRRPQAAAHPRLHQVEAAGQARVAHEQDPRPAALADLVDRRGRGGGHGGMYALRCAKMISEPGHRTH